MPTYEYQCNDCGHRFDLMQKMSDEPLKACPECQGTVRRLMSGGAGLLFKGSGFHVNDYPKNGRKQGCEAHGCDRKDTCPAARQGLD